jgi:hypothetical protein
VDVTACCSGVVFKAFTIFVGLDVEAAAVPSSPVGFSPGFSATVGTPTPEEVVGLSLGVCEDILSVVLLSSGTVELTGGGWEALLFPCFPVSRNTLATEGFSLPRPVFSAEASPVAAGIVGDSFFV